MGAGGGASTDNFKRLIFDNIYNPSAGVGQPCNKCQWHGNDWYAGVSLEDSAVAYHSGAHHRFYTAAKTGGLNQNAYGRSTLEILNLPTTDPTNSQGGNSIWMTPHYFTNYMTPAYTTFRLGYSSTYTPYYTERLGYPVVFFVSNWRSQQYGEVHITRPDVHQGVYGQGGFTLKVQWKPSIWGNGASFTRVQWSRSTYNTINYVYNIDVDQTSGALIIWLAGGVNTSDFCEYNCTMINAYPDGSYYFNQIPSGTTSDQNIFNRQLGWWKSPSASMYYGVMRGVWNTLSPSWINDSGRVCSGVADTFLRLSSGSQHPIPKDWLARQYYEGVLENIYESDRGGGSNFQLVNTFGNDTSYRRWRMVGTKVDNIVNIDIGGYLQNMTLSGASNGYFNSTIPATFRMPGTWTDTTTGSTLGTRWMCWVKTVNIGGGFWAYTLYMNSLGQVAVYNRGPNGQGESAFGGSSQSFENFSICYNLSGGMAWNNWA